METNFDVSHDPQLRDAAQTLLEAAHAYWKEYKRVLGSNAVVWLQGNDGSLVLFTRYEYKDILMQNIEHLRDEIHFY